MTVLNAPQGVADAHLEPELELELIRRARGAADIHGLKFIAVNDTHLLSPYRQAALWFEGAGVAALSGVVDMERNAPYVQWLDSVCRRLAGKPACRITLPDLDAGQAEEWADWLPEHAAWIPIAAESGVHGVPRGGLVLAREAPWTDEELTVIAGWIDTWRCIYHALAIPLQRRSWGARLSRLRTHIRTRPLLWTAIIIAILCIPVRLSVLAPAELVPTDPVVVRAPLDGVVQQFFVQPNQLVKKGDPLFAFDDITLGSKYDVAVQALLTAEAELRQYEQQALNDARARSQLPSARGSVAERRAELALLKTQRARSQVLAPQDGYALFDDPSEWIGRPVTTGERILRLAAPDDAEIEVWLGIGDAIPLPNDTEVRLYLSASPLDPIAGRVRYVSHDAMRRPDGLYAYRVRAKIEGTAAHRIGLKGTARLSGERVTLAYLLMRRPLATVREYAGL